MSTPMAEREEFPYGMQQLQQHNASLLYDNDRYTRSGHNSTYGTPEPSQMLVDGYGRSYNAVYGDQFGDTAGPQDVSSLPQRIRWLIC